MITKKMIGERRSSALGRCDTVVVIMVFVCTPYIFSAALDSITRPVPAFCPVKTCKSCPISFTNPSDHFDASRSSTVRKMKTPAFLASRTSRRRNNHQEQQLRQHSQKRKQKSRNLYGLLGKGETGDTEPDGKHASNNGAEPNDWELDDEEIEILFEEDDDIIPSVPKEGGKYTMPFVQDIDNGEKAWRYAKKALLTIGSKGISFSHGNSLRQLLDSHTAVKVKINTSKFNDSLEEAFKKLKEVAIESGADPNIELIQGRISENTILVGLPGTTNQIISGEFPPATPTDDDCNKRKDNS